MSWSNFSQPKHQLTFCEKCTFTRMVSLQDRLDHFHLKRQWKTLDHFSYNKSRPMAMVFDRHITIWPHQIYLKGLKQATADKFFCQMEKNQHLQNGSYKHMLFGGVEVSNFSGGVYLILQYFYFIYILTLSFETYETTVLDIIFPVEN